MGAGIAYLVRQHADSPFTDSVDRFARSFDAANQVFQITELVEMVLLNLDCIELMRAKCVSKMFKAVVESSPAARKALWVDAPGASMKVVSPG